jgi:selenocysteine lyase/cysteine desulfurase
LDDGTLDMENAAELMNAENIKLIAVTAASNVTGYMPPIEELAKLAHDHDAKILVDAAQRLAHYPLELKPLGHPEHIDFLAAAGHKFYSPFSSAFLLGNTEELDNAAPYIPGGGTVSYVTQDEVIYVKGPDRHQYGTPNIAGAIAMGESLNFLKDIGISHIAEHEQELLNKLLKGLKEIDGVELLGDIPAGKRIGVVTFNAKDIHHETVSKELNDREGIATRNGCFCAHPYVLRLMGVPREKVLAMRDEILKGNDPDKPGAVRVAIGIYNNAAEIDKLLNTVEAIIKDTP